MSTVEKARKDPVVWKRTMNPDLELNGVDILGGSSLLG
jgi:hypothetical protein